MTTYHLRVTTSQFSQQQENTKQKQQIGGQGLKMSFLTPNSILMIFYQNEGIMLFLDELGL